MRRCGPAAQGRWRLGQHQDVRGDWRRVKSQGWTPLILDTNGNGKRDEYVEPNQPRSDQGQAVASGPYTVMPNPVDGSIWYTVGVFAGTPAVLRLCPKRACRKSKCALAWIRHPRR